MNTTPKLEEKDTLDNQLRLMNQLIQDFESHVPENLRSERGGDMDFIKALYSNDVVVRYMEEVLRFDVWDRVAQINLPTLLITGGQDAITPPRYSEYLNKQIKNSEYHLLKEGGHYIPLQNHEFFNEKLRSFLERTKD